MRELDAEYSVVASCLLDNNAYYRVANLDPADFTDKDNRKAFLGIREILTDGGTADPITLCKRTGLDFQYITEMHRAQFSPHNISMYADILKTESRRRNIELTLRNSLARIEEESPESVATACMAGLQESSTKGKDVSLATALDSAFAKSLETQERVKQGTLAGISTTLPRLNQLTGGFRGPRMIVIGGRPGTYKTAYAFQVLLKAAQAGIPCGFVSLEMGADELAERALANRLHIDAHAFSQGDKLEYNKAGELCTDDLRNIPLWIDDYTQDWNQIEARIVEWKYRHKIQIAVVDYMQIIRHPGRRFDALSEISRRVKLLAKRLDMPIMLLTQLSRELERENRRPVMSDIRECGNIEQDADIIIFTHRITGKEQGADQYEMILAKQRSGPARKVIELEIRGQHYHVGERYLAY